MDAIGTVSARRTVNGLQSSTSWGSMRRPASGHSGHGGAFTAVSFSADGSLLCVGGSTARILDTGDGHVVMRRGVPGGDVVHTSISPDGTSLATVCRWKVRVHDARSGAETLSFRYAASGDCLRYSPDGTRIATLDKHSLGKTSTCRTQRPANCRPRCTSLRRRIRCSSAGAGTCW